MMIIHLIQILKNGFRGHFGEGSHTYIFLVLINLFLATRLLKWSTKEMGDQLACNIDGREL